MNFQLLSQQFALPKAEQLLVLNDDLADFNLYLSPTDAKSLLTAQKTALKDSGRIDFNGGILAKLLLAFASSPYLQQATLRQDIAQLTEIFYRFKNATSDQADDDDLLLIMRRLFDESGGSFERLCDQELSLLTLTPENFAKLYQENVHLDDEFKALITLFSPSPYLSQGEQGETLQTLYHLLGQLEEVSLGKYPSETLLFMLKQFYDAAEGNLMLLMAAPLDRFLHALAAEDDMRLWSTVQWKELIHD